MLSPIRHYIAKRLPDGHRVYYPLAGQAILTHRPKRRASEADALGKLVAARSVRRMSNADHFAKVLERYARLTGKKTEPQVEEEKVSG